MKARDLPSRILEICKWPLIFLCAFSFILFLFVIVRLSEYDKRVQPSPEYKYKTAISRIQEALKTFEKHVAHNLVAEMTDTFGHRLVGSEGLQQSIDWLETIMTRDGFENVHKEKVSNLTHWVRGDEQLELITPWRTISISIASFGNSVGTPDEGITAPIYIAGNITQMEADGAQGLLVGKIVVVQAPWVSYTISSQYRSTASLAAKYGALAAIVRSIAPFSVVPHAGAMRYPAGVPKIPVASISSVDADMVERMYNRNQTITMKLRMTCKTLERTSSYNVVGDIVGTMYPNEVVILGSHIDSWDVSNGVLDDGCGVFLAYEAMRVLIKLGLRPKRTLRFVTFTAEENGLAGGFAYRRTKNDTDMENTVAVFESDMGVFNPAGFYVTANDQAFSYIQDIAFTYLQHAFGIEKTNVERVKSAPVSDVYPFMLEGVPAIAPAYEPSYQAHEEKYFYYHHSKVDVISALDPDNMDESVALTASLMFIIADADERIPSAFH